MLWSGSSQTWIKGSVFIVLNEAARYLDRKRGVILLENKVPNIHSSVHFGGEEYGRSSGWPTAVRQVGQVIFGPHNGRFSDILRPNLKYVNGDYKNCQLQIRICLHEQSNHQHWESSWGRTGFAGESRLGRDDPDKWQQSFRPEFLLSDYTTWYVLARCPPWIL